MDKKKPYFLERQMMQLFRQYFVLFQMLLCAMLSSFEIVHVMPT